MSSTTREIVTGSWRSRAGVLLFYLGIPAIILVLHQLHASVVAVPRYDLASVGQFGWDALYTGLIALAAYALGLPEQPKNLAAAMIRSGTAGALGALSISVIQLLLGSRVLPRFTILGAVLLLVPWGAFCNWLVGGRAFGVAVGTRVLVVGRPNEIAFLDADLARDLEKPATVAARMTPAEAAATPTSLLDVANDVRPALLVLSTLAQQVPRVVEQVGALHESGVRVRSLTDFYEEWMGKMPAGELERTSLLFDIGEVHQQGYARVKRVFDVVGSALLLIPLALVTPLVWLGNLVGNRGPLFYTQTRVGKNDRPFSIIKFRTMTPGGTTTQWTAPDDPRVTSFGRFLRLTHIDELPQVVNVLRGELTLVGPRPEQPQYVAELSEKLPYYHLRHAVRPGITGWAQVKYPYGSSEQDALEKLQFEFYYLRHQSLGLDTRILVRTLRASVSGQGR